MADQPRRPRADRADAAGAAPRGGAARADRRGAALPLIEQLRPQQPSEADIILANLRLRQGRVDESTTALVSAFTRLRADPWAQIRFVQKSLVLAEAAGERNPAAARRLFDALQVPFSVQAADTPRLVTRVDLAVRFDFRGACQAAFGDLEPNIPWTRALLVMRRDCYQQNSDPRLPNALRDLDAYASREPIPLTPR